MRLVLHTPQTGQPGWVHYLPLATTVLAGFFVAALLHRYSQKGGAHLAWWAAGVACYGLGTGLEGAITLFGNSLVLNKAWYIAGALLGAYPLAQGTVWLLLPDRARLLTRITLPLVAVVSLLVLLSPVHVEELEAHRPGGQVLAWSWVRLLTPVINLYAVCFLVGGAVVSAVRFARTRQGSDRAVGNTLIATGALLPAIGGSIAKAGAVEALYVAELAGLLLIRIGYGYCIRPAQAAATSS